MAVGNNCKIRQDVPIRFHGVTPLPLRLAPRGRLETQKQTQHCVLNKTIAKRELETLDMTQG